MSVGKASLCLPCSYFGMCTDQHLAFVQVSLSLTVTGERSLFNLFNSYVITVGQRVSASWSVLCISDAQQPGLGSVLSLDFCLDVN